MPIRMLLLSLVLAGSFLHARSHPDYSPIIRRSEAQASLPARTVLQAAHHMVQRGDIIRGSCWDYLDAAFTRAGYPHSKRQIVYHKPKAGPYVNIRHIQPGDWLCFVNHSYGNVEHSGLFVGWIDRRRKQGLILSYPGERRNKPGRYRPYDLSSVYHIMRAQ